ncbi:peripheral-type benzodiazepine receptor-associated protein 1 isoform X2 [Nematostella vectensis]|uniref:peripheral-type benzodiazepine receptor-associated protein 1 isoform X2 n=1 Tax=Nematostella vectensis TaxID=45351 RepID=UPI0020772A3C|nr:peripheral-type benzodiazepine receptor-associated protein 1 isoform X2 [Nematostella vectensis]
MPMPSANGIAMVDREHTPSSSTRKTVEEQRRLISKLKAELELERTKLKQVHRDKTNEIKRNHENFERDRQRAIESVTKRLHGEHSVELRRVRDSITKEKDNELRQIVKFKDEECKALKAQITEEKDKNKRLEEENRRQLVEKSRDETGDFERRLRNEIHDLKEQKRKAEESLRLKTAADFEKAELIRRMKSEHEREVNELIRQSKREVAKEFQQIRDVEKALEEKNNELAFKDQLTRKLEAEKEEIRHRKASTEWSLLESPRRSLTGTLSSTVEMTPEPAESNAKINKDKERELRKKNAELQAKLDMLEKKCGILEKQNASKDSGNQKATSLGEEKIRKLKKRNSELVSIARQLEDKAKKLQDEKNAILKQANSKADNTAELEHMKKLFARQRAKDLAEHARIQMAKDNELEILRKEHFSGDNNSDKLKELQSIIKQTTKERLLLEKRLAETSVASSSPTPLPDSSGLEDHLKIEQKLKTESAKLKTAEEETVRLNAILLEKEKECEKLQQDIDDKQVKCSKLELERERFAAKCTMLHQKNSELSKKVKEMKQMEEEISLLKEDLEETEKEKLAAEEECQKLREQVDKLLHFKEDLQASEHQRKELEVKHKTSLDKLNERELEIRQLHKIQEESTRIHHLAVTALEKDVRSLEQRCLETTDKYETATLQLEQLRSRSSNINTLHKATQTSENTQPTPGAVSLPAARKSTNAAEPSVTPRSGKSSGDEVSTSNGDILETAASRIRQLAMSDSEDDASSSYKEKPAGRRSSGASQNSEPDDDILTLSQRISQAAISDDSTASASDDRSYESDASREVGSVADGDMGDLEDNDGSQCVVDMDDSIGPNRPKDSDDTATSRSPRSKGKRVMQADASRSDVSLDVPDKGQTNPEEEVEGEHLAVYIARYSYDPQQHSPNDAPQEELAFQAGDYLYIFGDVDEDGFYVGELMDGQRGLVPSNFVEKVADEDEMSWMMNGTDEAYDSSEEEEAEQALRRRDAADAVLTQKALLEPVKLLQFSGKLHRNLRLNVEHIQDANLADIVEEEEDDGGSVTEESREVLLSQDGVTSDDTDFEPARIPSPKRVSLERQFTRSVLLNWKAPDLPSEEIRGYGVYVNGDMRMMLKGSNRTKALIENIDPDKTYRISVRTLTTRGEESFDQEAMLTIGKDASVAPENVHVTSISPTSAKIEWLPGNSSYAHQIFVNGAPQRTIRPGTYQHTLMDLEPGQHYRVHVRARTSQFSLDENTPPSDDDPLTSAVEFATEKGGLPDAPLDVTLLPSAPDNAPNSMEVAWMPVTISDNGTSNGARVTGYKVYINDVQVAEVMSPVADGVTVTSWMTERAVKRRPSDILHLHVRTQSLSGESTPSDGIDIPLSFFDFRANRLIQNHSPGTPLKATSQGRHPVGEGGGLETRTEVYSGSDSGTELEDQNHNLREGRERPIKKERTIFTKTVENNQKDTSDHTPLVPEARTKGSPKVWQIAVEDETDSGDSNKREYGGSSEEDEAVEICAADPLNGTYSLENPGETGYQQLEEEPEIVSEKDQQSPKNVPRPEDDQASSSDRKISTFSEANDIDMEDLNRSLEDAQSLKTAEATDEGREGAKESFIRQLEMTTSDLEDSSESTPLSVIQEEEEDEVTEPQGVASRSSRTHSATESFLSDDDVLDLLDEEQEENRAPGTAVTAANVRRLSHEALQISQGAMVEDDGDQSLAPYLTSHTLQEREAVIPTPTIQTSDNLMEGIQIEEESPGNSECSNNAFNDAEADQGNATPQRTSTPLDSKQGYTPLGIREDRQGDADDGYGQGGDDTNLTYTLGDSEVPEDDQEGLVRIFIALYDYDPSTMSPNPGAEEEELKFSEGDLIKIFGEKDEDGFYWGECEGVTGFVPYNMVSEVQVEDDDLANQAPSSLPQAYEPSLPQDNLSYYPREETSTQVLEQSGQVEPLDLEETGPYQDGTEGIHLEETTGQEDEALDGNREDYPEENAEFAEFQDPRDSLNYSLPPKKMIALFDYDPRILSPNPDSEVELSFHVGDVVLVYGEMDEDGFFTGELNGLRGLVPSNFLEDLVEMVTPPTGNNVSTTQASSPSTSTEITPNGTRSTKQDKTKKTPEESKKKKGILSKGKQMLKKMTKGQTKK